MIPVLQPEFVEFIPEQLEDGKLYISEAYATVVHRCCCGCGHKVVTPLSPTGWRLTVEDGAVSLYPSIGNWGFPCRSHYWIRGNQVEWSYDMSKQQIDAGRRQDRQAKDRYYKSRQQQPQPPVAIPRPRYVPGQKKGFWTRLVNWLWGSSD